MFQIRQKWKLSKCALYFRKSKIEVISLENETKNDKLFSKINNHMYLGTYISTHYTLTIGDDKAYFEKIVHLK